MSDLIRSLVVFFFQAEDGIRDLVRSRGLGDVYKRQALEKRLRQGAAKESSLDFGKHVIPGMIADDAVYLSLIHI